MIWESEELVLFWVKLRGMKKKEDGFDGRPAISVWRDLVQATFLISELELLMTATELL